MSLTHRAEQFHFIAQTIREIGLHERELREPRMLVTLEKETLGRGATARGIAIAKTARCAARRSRRTRRQNSAALAAWPHRSLLAAISPRDPLTTTMPLFRNILGTVRGSPVLRVDARTRWRPFTMSDEISSPAGRSRRVILEYVGGPNQRIYGFGTLSENGFERDDEETFGNCRRRFEKITEGLKDRIGFH